MIRAGVQFLYSPVTHLSERHYKCSRLPTEIHIIHSHDIISGRTRNSINADMSSTVVFTCLFLLVAAATALPRQRRSASSIIVGGQDAGRNELPYQISLQYYSSHICGGSIINERYVVTAAHCVDFAQPKQLSVIAGDYVLSKKDGTEQKRDVKRIVVHEKYVNFVNGSDIALLEVSEPFAFNKAVQPIKLPPKDHRARGKTIVSGWGLTSPNGKMADKLQKVEVSVVSDEVCQKAYAPFTIVESMLCAGEPEGGKDSCQNDSGGPLVASSREGRYLVGIVSWGYSCAVPGYPGVYTEVAYFIDWIQSKIEY